jgi:hypothetical protein
LPWALLRSERTDRKLFPDRGRGAVVKQRHSPGRMLVCCCAMRSSISQAICPVRVLAGRLFYMFHHVLRVIWAKAGICWAWRLPVVRRTQRRKKGIEINSFPNLRCLDFCVQWWPGYVQVGFGTLITFAPFINTESRNYLVNHTKNL